MTRRFITAGFSGFSSLEKHADVFLHDTEIFLQRYIPPIKEGYRWNKNNKTTVRVFSRKNIHAEKGKHRLSSASYYTNDPFIVLKTAFQSGGLPRPRLAFQTPVCACHTRLIKSEASQKCSYLGVQSRSSAVPVFRRPLPSYFYRQRDQELAYWASSASGPTRSSVT